MTATHAAPAPRRAHRKAAVGVAATLLVAGLVGGGFLTTGAWFTASSTTLNNSVTAATVKLGATGDTDSIGSLVTATNLLPMTDAEATSASSTAPIATVNVRNTGSAPLNWSVQLTNLVGTNPSVPAKTDVANQLKAQVSTDNGTTWSAPGTLTSVAANVVKGSNLAARSATTVKVRLWFPSTVNNDYQGSSVAFGVTAKAIQANTSIDNWTATGN